MGNVEKIIVEPPADLKTLFSFACSFRARPKGLLSSFKPKKGKKKAKNGEPEETERTKTSKEAKP